MLCKLSGRRTHRTPASCHRRRRQGTHAMSEQQEWFELCFPRLAVLGMRMLHRMDLSGNPARDLKTGVTERWYTRQIAYLESAAEVVNQMEC